MKLWSCTNHKGFWPVPVASVVIAETAQRARDLLAATLENHAVALKPDSPDDLELVEIPLTEGATILSDGDY